MTLVLRPASASDVPAVRTLLARAYLDDPLMTWIFPDDVVRPDATAAWLGTFVEQYLVRGRIAVAGSEGGDGAVAGVAIWRCPDGSAGRVGRTSGAELTMPTLPTPSGIVAALIGAERAHAIGTAMAEAAAKRPSEPHVYLNFLAVAADRRRAGIGRALVEPGMAEARAAGYRVVLDSTDPGNHAFYQALGFEVIGSAQLGGDGPRMWTMAAG